MTALLLLLALALPHKNVTDYPGLTEPAAGYLLTADGRSDCSFRADAPWPAWCHDRWVMASDINTRADIRSFAARAAKHNARVAWAPGYTRLDGYASRFGGIVVIQAQTAECTPWWYRRKVMAALADIHGRTPALAEITLGFDGARRCGIKARRSLQLVRPNVAGSFVLDFRPD